MVYTYQVIQGNAKESQKFRVLMMILITTSQ